MSFRFQKRVKIAPGLRLNLSKSGVGIGAGVRGASVSVGKRGVNSSIGVPGTGIAYRQNHNSKAETNQEKTSGSRLWLYLLLGGVFGLVVAIFT